jgi:hypothetical protein
MIFQRCRICRPLAGQHRLQSLHGLESITVCSMMLSASGGGKQAIFIPSQKCGIERAACARRTRPKTGEGRRRWKGSAAVDAAWKDRGSRLTFYLFHGQWAASQQHQKRGRYLRKRMLKGALVNFLDMAMHACTPTAGGG